MTTAKIWPVPEILAGEEPFTLKETKGQRGMVCTDLVGKIMHVPTGDDSFGRMGRMHEMAHVAITPTEGMQRAQSEGIGPDYINVAEDMRVNMFLEDRNFELEASLPEELFLHRLKGYQLEEDLKGAVLMAVACKRLHEYKYFVQVFDYKWWEKISYIVNECEYILYGDHSFEGAIAVAKYLQRLFDSGALDKSSELDEDATDKIFYEEASDAKYGERDVDWGKMQILTPPLTVHLPQRRLNRRIKPKEHGSSLMFPSRLDQDDKIFGNMRRIAKGTVLVDVSGSMDLSSTDIETLVKEVPGVVVAVYSGDYSEGHLSIIASKGSMANMESLDWPSGNVVDGPALEWLAKQPEPRVWVCDGHVTGVNDSSSPKLTKQAYTIVARNKIRRAEEIADAPKLLKK